MNHNSLKQLASLLSALGLAHATAIAQAPLLVPGFLKFEVYTNIPGSAVSDLLASPDYPASPGRVFHMPSFDTRPVYPDDSHDNYGGRITGFITPTVSASYEFFLRSDNASQLFLSTDDDPANLQPIAEETTGGGPFEEPGAPETSFAHTLNAGQRYAIEVRYKAGTGADLCQVAWRVDGDPTPAAQLRPIPLSFLSTLIPPRGSVTITTQPTGATAGANDFITLNVAFTATHAPVVVQWQRNGANVPGLTGATASLGPLRVEDAGRYRAVVSIPGAMATSAEVNIGVTPDVTPPAIRRVLGSPTFDMLTVEFTEAITAASAVDPFNYALDGGLSISAFVIVSPNTVKLTTSPQTPGATYTLTINNIEDAAGLVSAPGASRTFTALERVSGGARFEAWLGIGGNAVSTLVGDPRYPASPDVSAYITRFTSRQVFADANSVDNYGGRLSGWIVPQESGDYHFFIRSDDNSELSLSTDADPANAVVIASESGCCGPFEEPGAPETSAAISLTAGQRYYIQALWKEGGGGDYCDVAWRRVGDLTPALTLPILSGNVLESYAAPGTFTPPTVAFASPANGAEFAAGEVVTLSVNAAAALSKTITKVEILQQGRIIATISNAPYALTFYELREDNHIFIARATDSAGLFTDSAPLTISVGVPVERLTLAAIDTTTIWRYDRTGRDLGTDWRQPGYDDSTWPQGPALIADEGTATVEPIRTRISRFNDQGQYVRTFYYRTHFNFDRPITPIVKLRLRHVVDDAVLFYLNGQEIHRFGIAPGVIVDYLTDAAGHENAYEGPYDIPLDYLVEGDNVLAAEVHQAGGSSSDMVFGGEFIATVPVVRTVLTIARNGSSVRISWTPSGGTLQSAPTPAGPWSPVLNATNPHNTAASETARFYRVSR
jgi:hypothetical protein